MISVAALEMPRLIVDFETYSERELRHKNSVGVWRYAEDPSTEILCMAYKFVGTEQETKLWVPDYRVPDLTFPKEVADHVLAGRPIEAHNVPFERAIWTHILHKNHGIPLPKRWIDTMATCAYRALPLALEKVGGALDMDIQKDKRGTYLLGKLSRPQKPTKKNPSTRCTDYSLMEELWEYCKRDVDVEEALGAKIGDLPAPEYRVWVMDQKINARGVYIDLEAVLAAKEIVEAVTKTLTAELIQVTGGYVQGGGEVAKIGAWIETQGQSIPNLQAGTIEDFLKFDWLLPQVRRVLEIRQILSSASVKKLDKFIQCVQADQRIRGLIQYHGASTGRFAGRLVQPHNFPKGFWGYRKEFKKDTPGWLEYLITTIKTKNPDLLELVFGDPLEAISSALRGMIIATPGKKMYVADFSSIEARVVMWVAGQDDAVQVFADYDKGIGQDIYCQLATEIVGYEVIKGTHDPERQLGKVGILGCGYQMSWLKLQATAAKDGTVLSDERAQLIVDTYRKKYSEVVDFWRGVENAAIECVQEQTPTRYKKIRFEFIVDDAGSWLVMVLPNGRKLWYYDPLVEPKTFTYIDKKTGELKSATKDQVSYMGKDSKKQGKWGRISTYGGMLTENAVQAISRDLMVEAMIRLEAAGYFVILTVHDEIVCERADGTGSLEEFLAIVKGPVPIWASRCPVNAEGWTGYRYRK